MSRLRVLRAAPAVALGLGAGLLLSPAVPATAALPSAASAPGHVAVVAAAYTHPSLSGPSWVDTRSGSFTLRGAVAARPGGIAVAVEQAAGGGWRQVTVVRTGRTRSFSWQTSWGAGTLATTSFRVRATYGGLTRYSAVVTVQRGLPSDDVRLTDTQARAVLASKGVSIASTGRCSDRRRATCTSLDTIRTQTIRAVVGLKDASGCGVQVNGGTEVGHAVGRFSHGTGYKVDIARTPCVDAYIRRTARLVNYWYRYRAPVTYYREAGHWDLLVTNDPPAWLKAALSG